MKFPYNTEYQFYTALMQYPELWESAIVFKTKKLKTTMACRPKFLSLLRNKQQRKYLIIVNNQAHRTGKPVFDSLTFNAQVGLIGHELGHISYYLNRPSALVLLDGLRYICPKFKRNFERETDIRTLKHGFKWQLFEFSSYIQDNQYVLPEYKKYKLKFYLSPQEIADY